MEECSTLEKMMEGNTIYVPRYQRAYSWDVPEKGSGRKAQVDVFYDDILTHTKSGSTAKYYIGHFLFEDKGENRFAVIDGQQRLTTVVIL